VAIPTFVAAGRSLTDRERSRLALPAGWAQDDIFISSSRRRRLVHLNAWRLYDDRFRGTGTGAGSTKELVAYRRATASESAPTVTDTGDHTLAVILAFRGCITSGARSPPSPATSLLDHLAQLHDDHHDGSRLPDRPCRHARIDTTGGQVSGYSNASLTSLAELFDDSATDGFGGGIFVAAGGKTAAGSTGSTSATLASSGNAVLYSLALIPVPAPRAYPNSMPSISHFIGR
jgi:hypothetical protein